MIRNDPRRFLPGAAMALTLLLLGWAAIATTPRIATGFGWTIFLLTHLIVFIDLLDLGLRIWRRRPASGSRGTSLPLSVGRFTPYQRRLHLRPWALLVSVYEAEDELDDFIEQMEPYRDHLWVIDDGSRDDTRRRLIEAGIRCLPGGANRRKPGAIRALLRHLPPEVETVMVLDPDTQILDSGKRPPSDLETVLFDFQRSGMAAVCPRIRVRKDGFLARFQALEYAFSCELGRSSLGGFSLNSGVSIYRREALESALAEHSLSVYAEDLENSFILLGRGEKIYYDDRLTVETEGQRRWKGWFSQRVGWSYGFLKVYVERFAAVRALARRHPMAAYQFLVYMGLFSLLLFPLKLIGVWLLGVSFLGGLFGATGTAAPVDGLAASPFFFLSAYFKYTFLAALATWLAVPRGERLYLMPIVPLFFFYAIAHLLPQAVGYANWTGLRLVGRRLFRDHYQDEETLRWENGAVARRRRRQRARGPAPEVYEPAAVEGSLER